MSFTSIPVIKYRKVIFPRKPQKINHNPVYLKRHSFQQIPSQKHFRMFFNIKLNFHEHLNNVLSKVKKKIVLLLKFQAFLLHQSLVAVRKLFTVPHLDYGDTIYNQTYNDFFHQNLKSIQSNAALAITGTIRGISRQNHY